MIEKFNFKQEVINFWFFEIASEIFSESMGKYPKISDDILYALSKNFYDAHINSRLLAEDSLKNNIDQIKEAIKNNILFYTEKHKVLKDNGHTDYDKNSGTSMC